MYKHTETQQEEETFRTLNGLTPALQTDGTGNLGSRLCGVSCSIFSAAYFLIMVSTSLIITEYHYFCWPHKPALHHSTPFKKLCKDTIRNENKIKSPITGPRHCVLGQN